MRAVSRAQSETRKYTPLDRLVGVFDRVLRTTVSPRQSATRESPAVGQKDLPLLARDRRHSAGLMRVNHTGEVCAQALYLGQALVARDEQLKVFLLDAAAEEQDHLVWCAQRLDELESRSSLLNPFWFAGSVGIALVAATVSDATSLGFVEETERQVCAHLDGHLAELSSNDLRSRAIVAAMRDEEEQHAINANLYGAEELPPSIKNLMRLQARVMTVLAYWF